MHALDDADLEHVAAGKIDGTNAQGWLYLFGLWGGLR